MQLYDEGVVHLVHGIFFRHSIFHKIQLSKFLFADDFHGIVFAIVLITNENHLAERSWTKNTIVVVILNGLATLG